MLKSPPLVATLSDSMRMSPCSWGDIFTWPLRGDRIIGLRHTPVAIGFTAAGDRVSVFSRTAIYAPGGWASDREPAKRFDGRPRHGWVVVDGNSFPENKASFLVARAVRGVCCAGVLRPPPRDGKEWLRELGWRASLRLGVR